MRTVKLFETFVSIQGESTYAGLTCFFIRLAGCNLRCRYCDTVEARKGGRDVAISSIVKKAREAQTAIVEITGGEPLIQPGFVDLARALKKTGRPVLVETNGSRDVSVVPEGVVAVMDVKCPGSGESRAMDMENLRRLRPYDEVKFVISNRKDYDWAKKTVVRFQVSGVSCQKVLFSPVTGVMNPATLARWIMKDRLEVRLQAQLHKLLGVK